METTWWKSTPLPPVNTLAKFECFIRTIKERSQALVSDLPFEVISHQEELRISGGRGGGGSIVGVPKNCFGATPYFLLIVDIKKQN
jgi:hypothetical protein